MIYHFQVGFPKTLKTKLGTIPLRYSEHSKSEAVKDRCIVDLPKTLNTDIARVVEAESPDGVHCNKIVYRTHYDVRRDIIIVVMPNHNYFVKTVWLNDKSDFHGTLDRSKYDKP